MCKFRFVCWRGTVYQEERCRWEKNQRELLCASSVSVQDCEVGFLHDCFDVLTSFSGCLAVGLAVHYTRNIAVLYAVPIAYSGWLLLLHLFSGLVLLTAGMLSSSGQFCSLSSVMADPNTNEEDRFSPLLFLPLPLYVIKTLPRNMLSSVDEWLQERHALPYLDPSLYFLGGEGEDGGVGGVVRAVIENPVFLCPTAPPEDQLVISLNNPTFSTTHSTIDFHATQA